MMALNSARLRKVIFALVMINLVVLSSGCFFFRKKSTGESASQSDNPVLGDSLGNKARRADLESLEEIYALDVAQAPAAIRPDPDTYIRRLLLQYREEGSTVAREIGRVEAYRPLIGGASDDFKTLPQDRFDATSLLASLKVAEELCRALVDPSAENQPGWSTILPYRANKVIKNIEYLAQRFTGVRSDKIPTSKLDQLRAIFNLSVNGGSASNANYVPVCTVLAVDAEGLLL
jgi:hypothetical protein